MENLIEKLNTFTSLVLKDASKKRDEILETVERAHQEKLTKKENEFLEEAYEEIQRSVAQAQKHSNAMVLQEELEAKKKLLLTREKIIRDVMDAASDRLKEFAAGEKYEAWLLDKIKKSIFEVGKGSKIVYIAPNDLQYKEKIEELCDERITVTAAEEHGFLGGAKVYNPDRRVAVDYSFCEMLSEQRSEFLQSSGLSIN